MTSESDKTNGSDGRPISQVRRAVGLLREMIITNKLLPGSNHLESELAELLGMSRTPVHEAAILLETQGLIEVIPRRGIRVLPLSAADMEEIYAILTELESLAAYDLAQDGLTPEQLATLRAHIDEMEAALEVEDRPRWASADDSFHRDLVAMGRNRRLTAIVSTYWDQVQRARLLTLYMRPLPHRSNADHRALVDAIAEGDAERARAIHRKHRLNAKRLMVELIAQHGLTAV